MRTELDLRGRGAVTLRPGELTSALRETTLATAGWVLDLIRRERRPRAIGYVAPVTAHHRYCLPHAAPTTKGRPDDPHR